jgi:GLPGLI family protein
MKKFSVLILLACSCIVCLLLASCGDNPIFRGKSQGVIYYDVTFPYEQNSLMVELFPKEMILDFKGKKMHSNIKSSYGVVATDFIIDSREHTIVQMLKSFTDRYAMTLEDEHVEKWIHQYPTVRIEYTNETDSIAGYLCRKAVAYFQNDSLPSVDLFYTKDLNIETSNWWNQFQGLDGFLLGYDIEQYGKRMRLRAREISFEEVPDEKFTVPTNYLPIDIDGMNAQMDKLVDEFMK